MTGLLRRWRAWRRYLAGEARILDAGYRVSPQTDRLLAQEAGETP